jgi:triphosphatase
MSRSTSGRRRAARRIAGCITPSRLSRPRDSVAAAARRLLRHQVDYYRQRTAAAGWTADPEAVHDARVTLRRLRSGLRLFEDELGDAAAARRADLKRIAGALGAARDADVFAAFARACRAEAPPDTCALLNRLAATARRERTRRAQRLAQEADGTAARAVWRRLHRLTAPPRKQTATGPRLIDEAPRLLWRTLRRALRYDRPLGRYALEQLHALRIACKHVRYAAEYLAGLYPDGLADLIADMREMQRLLGAVHDAEGHLARLRAHLCAARAAGDSAASRGSRPLRKLLAQQHQRNHAEATRLWRRYLRPSNLRQVKRRIRKTR